MMERVGRGRRKYRLARYPESGVILLNADYTYLNVLKPKKAVKLLTKGKAEVLKATNIVWRNAERTIEILVPKIMRLIKMVRTLYKNKVPYSKRNVFIRDGFQCQYCSAEPGKLTIEHVIPRHQGGKSTWENTVAACKPCNDMKGSRTPSEAGMYLKKQPVAPTISEFLKIRMEKLGISDVINDFLTSAVT